MTATRRPSYKPAAGRLVLTDEIKRVQYSLFKGIQPKTLRIGGALMDAMEAFFDSQRPDYEEGAMQKTAETLMRAFFTSTEPNVDSRKKRFFQTGVSHKRMQLLLTEFVYPVPHVKGISIVVVAIDFRNVKTGDKRLRSSYWCLNFDPGYEHLEDHYTKVVKVTNIDEYTPLDEIFVEMIFSVVPPKSAA